MRVNLTPVEPDEVTAIQAVIESDPGYVERVTGLPPGPADAQSLLMMRPPDLAEDRKLVLAVRREDDVIGIIDLLRGYPEESTAYLGLLEIRHDLQGRGFGRAAHEALLELVRTWPEIRRVRIAIVATNDAAVGHFWRALGYAPSGDPVPYVYDKLETTAQRLELPI